MLLLEQILTNKQIVSDFIALPVRSDDIENIDEHKK